MIADSIEKEAKLNITERPMEGFIINDKGTLYKSISQDKTNIKKTIHFSVPYASGLEWGHEPHKANYNEIYEWVQRKVGISDPSEAKGFALYVVKKLAYEGQIPRRFVSDAIERTKQAIETK
ncbi:MAG: hypothetical protein ACOYWZ_00170 [Bacillota bacterium]